MHDNGSSPETSLNPIVVAPQPPRKFEFRDIFIGPNGIRAGWRVLIYLCIFFALGFALRMFRRHVLHVAPRNIQDAMDPVKSLVSQINVFALMLGASLIMAWIERENWGNYGLPLRRAFSKDMWLGLFWGFAGLTLVMGCLWLTGCYRIEGFALSGAALWKNGVLWGLMFLFVGLGEEFFTRGYLLYTLASGMGFWASAILTSAIFFAGHLANPGENWMGLADVFIIGVFLCLTLWRTGNLWFAVAMHASWDWGLTYFYSVPNSGTIANGHLFNIHTQGPRWLSGGDAGPEGSVLNIVFDLLCFLIFMLIYKRRKWVGMTERRQAAVAAVASEKTVSIDSSALNG